MEQREMDSDVVNPVTSGKTASVDTYNYRGWLNSDSFWKRALSVYGYSIVGGTIIAIPLMIIIIPITFFAAFSIIDSMHMQRNSAEQHETTFVAPKGKINVYAVCADIAQHDVTITNEQKDQFTTECIDGKHPDAIERYVQSQGVDDGRAI